MLIPFFFKTKQNKKETRLEQSWPFLKKSIFHSQLPWLCCCCRIINDNRIFIKKKKKKNPLSPHCVYNFDLVDPQMAQALLSEGYTQVLNLPAPPVWFVSPVWPRSVAFPRSCWAACVTGFTADMGGGRGGGGGGCCSAASTGEDGGRPTVSLLCESTATTAGSNCCSAILGRSGDGRALQCSVAQKSTACD